jgi:lipid-A-disaccharide synthase
MHPNRSRSRLAEILRHLPRLLRLRRDLVARMVEAVPDVFVGIDSPEFNLRVARQLAGPGVRTVQVRQPTGVGLASGPCTDDRRVRRPRAVPVTFESAFYDAHHVRAVFVGHPLADRIPLDSDPVPARAALGLSAGAPVVAVLPGAVGARSQARRPFARTMAWLHDARPGIEFVAPMANAGARAVFELALAAHAPGVNVRLVDGRAQDALTAADAVLVASGTATLETALVKRPMVVAYRVAPLTGWLLREMGLVKTDYFSQPNLLAGRKLVPEFFQEQVRPEVLGPAVLGQLERSDRAELVAAFAEIHRTLRRDASARAAEAILELRAGRGLQS